MICSIVTEMPCALEMLLAVVAGNRMFSFNEDDVDFFLPQLLTLYINMHDVAEATHPYIVYRSCVYLLLCCLS